MRKAKIVCTIGPASQTGKVIRELISGGMDVARLNFSHGDHATHQQAFSLVRTEAAKQKRPVSILQDLQGIKIRIGDLRDGLLSLHGGEKLLLYPGHEISEKGRLFISYPALLRDVKEGDSILIDDGLIKLHITGKTKDALKAEVLEGGELSPRKGVNLPHSRTTLPGLTEKDKKDLELGLSLGIDYLALSFVRTLEDIELVRRWAKRKGMALPPIIAKIEKPEALKNIEEIMDRVEGIMVARGDLGVEMPPEEVPVIQKRLIDLANKKGKLVITATQMLESMTEHSRPTRAEATDVANAVLDGTDAVMLSAETASGRYPVEAVRMMDRIIRYTEEGLPQRIVSSLEIGNTFPEAVADSGSRAAHDIGAKAIVVFTHSGFTAGLLSKLRPSVPIIAFTPDEKVCRRLSLLWGSRGMLIGPESSGVAEAGFMAEIENALIGDKIVKKGDSIVFIASSPFLGKPNIMRLHKVG
ncbi:MAG: pyruvate kinase [Thermodesulfovibrionales bacterium]|jgi:pyruvate kinase